MGGARLRGCCNAWSCVSVLMALLLCWCEDAGVLGGGKRCGATRRLGTAALVQTQGGPQEVPVEPWQ